MNQGRLEHDMTLGDMFLKALILYCFLTGLDKLSHKNV